MQILGANGASYAATVDGNMGAYPYDQEIIDACLEADASLVTESYFSHPTLGNSFYTVSGNLANGAIIPSFCGIVGKVQLQNSNNVWEEAVQAQSKDDVINLQRYGLSYLGAANIEGLYFLARNGYIYHSSPTYARVYYPSFTKTAALQSLDIHEQAVIAGALMLLYKYGSPLHSEQGAQFYTGFFEAQKQRIALNQDLDKAAPIPGGGE